MYCMHYFVLLSCSNKNTFTAKKRNSSIVAYGSLAAAYKQIATTPATIEIFKVMQYNDFLWKEIKASLKIPSPIIDKKIAFLMHFGRGLKRL